jgi:membrane associated rhomboid family serine protease
MFLPYSTALRLGKPPWVTITLVILCTVIYWQQAHNDQKIQQHVKSYCQADPEQLRALFPEENAAVVLNDCQELLTLIHSRPSPEVFFQRLRDSNDLIKLGANRETLVKNLERLYQDFLQTEPPWDLTATLVYAPLGWNPLRMLTSSLAHGSGSHLIGNMIFFIAFAPALELLVGGTWRFIAILLATACAASLTYSLSVLAGASPLPTLGFSGVVTGMIGLSAFLMPKARIKTVYWVGVPLGHFYFPAWMLALWFIGWDVWRIISSADVGNVNVIAHVAGGVAGYLIGWRFLRQQRELNQDDLDEVMWQQRWQRNNWFSGSSGYRKRPETYQNEIRLEQAKRDYQAFIDRLIRAVRARQNSEAVLVLLEYYNLYQQHPDAYEDLFQEMKVYGHCRAVQCAGRLVISLYLQQGKRAAAFRVLEECLQLSPHFALGGVDEAATLFRYALSLNQRTVARQILRHAQHKYGASQGAVLHKMGRELFGLPASEQPFH